MTTYQHNQGLGIICDAIAYSTIFFNGSRFVSYLNRFAKSDVDVLEHYDAFRAKYLIEPPPNLYPFFAIEGLASGIVYTYLEDSFDFYSATEETFLKLFEAKKDFKRFAYTHYIDPLDEGIAIEAVVDGHTEKTALVLSLLTAKHPEYAKAFHLFLYRFDDLIEELVRYLVAVIQKIKLYHNKHKSYKEQEIENFIQSEDVDVVRKTYYQGAKFDFATQIYAVQLFNRIIFRGFAQKDGKRLFIIGDKSSPSPTILSNYESVTDQSAAQLLATNVTRAIFDALRKKEQTVTQLTFNIHYSRSTIEKYVRFLVEELAIRVSRKNGNEMCYALNPSYFRSAKVAITAMCDALSMDVE